MIWLVAFADHVSTVVLLVVLFGSFFSAEVWANGGPESKMFARVFNLSSALLLMIKFGTHAVLNWSATPWWAIYYAIVALLFACYSLFLFPRHIYRIYVVEPRENKKRITRRDLERYKRGMEEEIEAR